MFTVIVICGPTAIGKTELAIKLAIKLQTEIINADSRQLYKEISIGTAKPSIAQLSQVKHHFVDTHSVSDYFTAGDFEKQSLQIIDSLISQQKKTVVVSGGTGLYINALINGMHELPDGDEEIRAQLKNDFEKFGLDYLLKKLQELDADAINDENRNNPQRLMRILEVCMVSGKKYSEFIYKQKVVRNFKVIKISLDKERKQLYSQIEKRVDLMMNIGLLDEVKSMIDFKNSYALKTVGYKELFDYFEGVTDLQTAVNLIKQHTRNYAKRQLTWFRKDKEYKWFQQTQEEEIYQYIKSQLA